MKNQYFGDINDYKKYGILRILSAKGSICTGVCWMLTNDNEKGEGKFTGYIEEPVRWRKYDPPLFDSLAYSLKSLNVRNVALAEQLDLIDNSKYHYEIIGRSFEEREKYFNELRINFSGCDLIFFDPDNGIEVGSTPCGRKDSDKYIYWRELNKFYEEGYSLLVYQHFPRVNRKTFIENINDKIRNKLNTKAVIFYQTSNVVFILIPQQNKLDYFLERSKVIVLVWNPEIKCLVFNNDLLNFNVTLSGF